MVALLLGCLARDKHVAPEADLYQPNHNFADNVNHNVVQSEIDGGVYLRDLRCGALLEIETCDWNCTMIYCGECNALVSGHARICPDWVQVQICGSTWGGSMLKEGFIGRGMCLEFLHPSYRRIVTSVIMDVRERNLTELLHTRHAGSPASAKISSSPQPRR